MGVAHIILTSGEVPLTFYLLGICWVLFQKQGVDKHISYPCRSLWSSQNQ